MNFNYNGSKLGTLPGIEHLFMLGTGPDYYWSGESSDAKDIIGFTGLTYTSDGASRTYIDDSGVVQTTTSALRYETRGGIKAPLLEPAGANILLQALTDWAATNCTIAKDATGAQGTENRAYTLTATDANATLIADALSSSHANHNTSYYVKRKTGTGAVYLTLDNGSTWTEIAVTDGWLQLDAGQATTNPQVGFKLAVSGDAIYIDYPQVETNIFASSSIDNDSVSAGADLVTDGGFAAVTETNSYTSDFSAGVDGFTYGRTTVAGNIDGIGGQDDCLRITVNTDDNKHYTSKTFFTVGNGYRIRFKYYIPSGQSNVDGIKPYAGSSLTSILQATDAWTAVDVYTNPTGTGLAFYAADGGSLSFQDAGGDDVFYIKDVIIDTVTLTNFTAGAGFAPEAVSGSLTGKVKCTAGTASTLTQATAAEANKSYQVAITATRSAGSFTTGFGGATSSSHSASATTYDYLVSTTTGGIVISKDADFAGTLDDLVIKEWGNARPSEAGKCKFDLPSGLFAETLGADALGGIGAFAASTGWSIGANVGISGGTCNFTGSGSLLSNDNRILTSLDVLTIGTLYKLQFTVTDYTSGEIRVTLGTTSDVISISTPSATTYTYYVKCLGNRRFYMWGNGTFSVDNLTIEPVANAWDGMPPHFTMLAWWMPGYARSMVTATHNIIATYDGSASLMYLPGSSYNPTSYDGSGAAAVSAAYAANTWYKLALQVYVDSNVYKFRVGVDSGSGISWGTSAVFDGAYTVGSYLNIFYTLFGPSMISRLAIWKRILGDAEINAYGGSPT